MILKQGLPVKKITKTVIIPNKYDKSLWDLTKFNKNDNTSCSWWKSLVY